jgi:hypothetical protein
MSVTEERDVTKSGDVIGKYMVRVPQERRFEELRKLRKLLNIKQIGGADNTFPFLITVTSASC